MLLFTETWLNNSVLDSEILCNEYSLFRCDRNVNNSKKKCGGGVLIAVNKKYMCKKVKLPYVDVEMLCVSIDVSSYLIYLLCAYIPPTSTENVFSSCHQNLEYISNLLKDNDEILLAGDFNIPEAVWIPSHEEMTCQLPSCVKGPYHHIEFLDNLQSIPLFQVNNIVNSHERILDLVFSDNPNELCISKADPLLNVDLYHPPLSLYFPIYESKENSYELKDENVYEYNFKSTDFEKLNSCLQNADWSPVYSSSNINEATLHFYSILFDLFEECIPKRKKKFINTSPLKWVTPEIQKLKNKKSNQRLI